MDNSIKNETALFEFDIDQEGMARLRCRMHYLKIDKKVICFFYLRQRFVARINCSHIYVGEVSMSEAQNEALDYLRLHPEHFRPFEPKGLGRAKKARKGL